MGQFTNLSISKKLSLIPIIGVIGFVGYFFYNWSVIDDNNQRLNEISEVTLPVLLLSRDNLSRITQLTQVYAAVEESGDDENLVLADDHAKSIEEKAREIAEILPDVKADMEAISTQVKNFNQMSRQRLTGIMTMTLSMEKSEQMKVQLSSDYQTLFTTLEDNAKHYDSLLKSQIQNSQSSGDRSLQIGLITGFIIIVLLTFSSFTIINATVRSIKRVTQSLKAIAQGEGDLSNQIKSESDDELGELVKWFNMFSSKLQKNIISIIDYTKELQIVSGKLHDSSNNSTERLQHQLNAVIEVSGAQQQLSTSIHQVGKTSEESSGLAKTTDLQTIDASKIVATSKATIDLLSEELDQSSVAIIKLSEDISDISVTLDAIKQISDQTNLLALNAAIEAARAGEQGRGFAVVADEVRALASRTQESTIEIQNVIEGLNAASAKSVDAMVVGKKRADDTVVQIANVEETLGKISSDVSSIHELNSQIATVTRDQDQNGMIIQNSINAVQNTVEKGVNGAQAAEALSKQLASISQQMKMVTDTFKT